METTPRIGPEAMGLLIERYGNTKDLTAIWNRVVRETYSYELADAVVDVLLRPKTLQNL
jgi:hypothetical protein